jgi:hypothetical protein
MTFRKKTFLHFLVRLALWERICQCTAAAITAIQLWQSIKIQTKYLGKNMK